MGLASTCRSATANWAIGATLFVGSVLFVLAAGEAWFRARRWIEPLSEHNPTGARTTWVAPDPDLGYRLRPNPRRMINADGLVGPPMDPTSSRFRVLVVGDSVIFGRDNIIGRAAEILSRDPAVAPLDFLNSGVPGYTNYQQVTFLKRDGVRFKPSLVGIVFVLNDLHRFLHAPRFDGDMAVGQTFWDRSIPSDTNSVLARLMAHSLVLAWLHSRVRAAPGLLRVKIGNAYTFDHNPDFRTAWDDNAWKAVDSQISEAAGLGKQAGFRLFLVAVPFGEQLRADYLARDAAYVTKPQRRLREICSRLGIAYLDVMPLVDRRRHLQTDFIHLTNEGKTVVAQALAKFLKKEQLIPAR
jgi:hypothetical protein